MSFQKVEGFSYSPFFRWLDELQRNLRRGGFAVMAVPTNPPTIHIWREKK